MDIVLYLAFVLAAFVFIVVPGPNVLVIVSTSLHQGLRRGLQTVAGTSAAMVLQLFIAAVASLSFIELVQQGLWYLKWVGLAYLLYLAFKHWRLLFSAPDKLRFNESESASWTFTRGFLVSLSNPKTILFFTAFLPQFCSADYSYAKQIFILSVSFLFMATLLDSLYAVFAQKLRQRICDFQARHEGNSNIPGKHGRERHAWLGMRVLYGISAVLYSCAAVGLYLHAKWRA